MACDIHGILCSACSGSPLQAQLAALSRLELLRAMYAMQCQINKSLDVNFNCATVDPCVACLSDSDKLVLIAAKICE